MTRFLTLTLAAALSLTACNDPAQTTTEPSTLSQNYPIALQKIAGWRLGAYLKLRRSRPQAYSVQWTYS